VAKLTTMKKSITSFVVIGTLLSTSLAESTRLPAEAHYQKGLAAEKASDPVAAAEHFRNALKVDPKHANARFSLGQLKITSASMAAKGREAKFGNVTIPAFRLNEATLQEALEAFSIILEKESNEEVTPNFVIQDPKNILAQRKITLDLKNMPSKAVMKYLMDQSGSKARYDEYAVVITPR
jgi:tetratricopeptide (TPR) repeat protein